MASFTVFNALNLRFPLLLEDARFSSQEVDWFNSRGWEANGMAGYVMAQASFDFISR